MQIRTYVLGPLGPRLHSGAAVVPQSVQTFGTSIVGFIRFYELCERANVYQHMYLYYVTFFPALGSSIWFLCAKLSAFFTTIG